MSKIDDGWLPLEYDKVASRYRKQSYSYSWPQFKWWQFIQKRRWSKKMSNITPGSRIRFTYKDGEIVGCIKVEKEPNE